MGVNGGVGGWVEGEAGTKGRREGGREEGEGGHNRHHMCHCDNPLPNIMC